MIARLMYSDSRRLGEARARQFGVLRVRVETRADRSAAERDSRQLVHGALGPADRFLHLAGVALELLAEADRRGVLAMGAAGFHHRPELRALRFECLLQVAQSRDELAGDRHRA